MKIYFIKIVFLFLMAIVLTQACQNKSDHNNPNGQSELSALMREMQKDLALEKEKLNESYLKKEVPSFYAKLKSAKATNESMKKENYDANADQFLETINTYYAGVGNKIENYNAIVNSCKGCHMTHCPGPLKAINKMLIPE